jgi:ADP-L-glycero-D-manno-heptose 6-epimerase
LSVLVTGACGFIGRHVANCFSNSLLCDVIEADNVWSPDEIDFDLEKPDVVYHLGAISSTTESDTYKIAQNNISFSCFLLEECVKHNVPFVYASSASVYGTGKYGFKENASTSPINYYAISKASFDDIASQKAKDHPEATVVGLRYFNVYGSGEDHKKDMASPIHKFFVQSEESGTVRIFEGSEKFVRDFIHVSDVAKITKSARHFPSGIYNVGTGVSRSFLDVATLISSHTKAKIVVIPFPDHLIGKYQSLTCSENSKINNYYPPTRLSLEDGIKKFIK